MLLCYFRMGIMYACHMQSNCRFLPIPRHLHTRLLFLDIQIPTTNDKGKEVMRPLLPASTIYTPANVCPTISLPHIAPLSCSLLVIQPLNSSMVILAFASFHSMLPGR